MDQENLRNRFNLYLENTGVRQVFLSKKMEIPTDVLSRFKTGQRELYESFSEKLDAYLNSKGY